MEDLAKRIKERHKQLSNVFPAVVDAKKIQKDRALNLEQKVTSYCSSRELLKSASSPLNQDYKEWIDFWSRSGLEKRCYPSHRVYSEYSKKHWDSIIYQDPVASLGPNHLPAKISILHNIRKNDDMEHPVFICYMRLQSCLLNQVNSFLCQTFWPGINIKDSLSCPEYSIIALYGRFVIGAGFVTPNGYITYLAVHPDWGDCGVGKRMLFYLVNATMRQDITMHVSATNTAMILYQEFGFKIEEFILHFYDKYYPNNDIIHCKHALFLRLRQNKQ